MKNVRLFFYLVASVVVLFIDSSSMYAQPGDPPPTAFLERAPIVGVGKTIHITRVPTQDVNGAVRYLDVDITLNINELGVIDAATVISADSPSLLTNKFIAGDYQNINSIQCELMIGVALQGRATGVFNCFGPNSWEQMNITWYTGPIVGHPFEIDLTTAGIDQIPGHETFSWGKVALGANIGTFNCFYTNQIIGVNQVGNSITITNYGDDTSVDCGHNFTLVQP